jgi:hypothetical protein
MVHFFTDRLAPVDLGFILPTRMLMPEFDSTSIAATGSPSGSFNDDSLLVFTASTASE